MVVPVAVVKLDETHAALGEPAREQAVGGKRAVARGATVELEGARIFAAQVRELRHARLHLERQLVLRDARRDLGVMHEGVVLAVERDDRVDVGALLRARDATGVVQVVHGVAATVELHALETARQKSAAPLPCRDRLRRTAGARRHHHDEAREIFRLAAKPVVDPRAHARATGDLRARVHEHVRRVVVDRVGRHRAHKADVVDHRAEVRKQRADLGLVFPELGEGKLRREADEFLPLQLRELLPAREALRHGLAMHRRELRLRVEGLELRRPARHREPDHAFGPLGLKSLQHLR